MSKRTTGRRVPGFDKPLPAPVVLGLDLSLRATCMAAAPINWGLDWSRVQVARAGSALRRDAEEHERIQRLLYITDDVVRFAQQVKAQVVFIEQYAMRVPRNPGPEALGALSQAHALGELGGHVKCELQSMGLAVVTVAPASARKLLGTQPRKDAKEWAARQLMAAGAPREWIGASDDRYGIFDAVTVMNFGMSVHGRQAIMMQPALAGVV